MCKLKQDQTGMTVQTFEHRGLFHFYIDEHLMFSRTFEHSVIVGHSFARQTGENILRLQLKMCFKRLSIFSAPYFICLCYIELADSRLLMIPSERHLNLDQMTTNSIIRKVLVEYYFSKTCLIHILAKLSTNDFVKFSVSTLQYGKR